MMYPALSHNRISILGSCCLVTKLCPTLWFQPRIETVSPSLQADSLPSEPPGRRTSLILDNSLLLLPSLSLLILIVNMMMVFSFTYREFGKLSSGHRTGKGQFSFQFQRKAMPKNAQTTAQLHSSHKLVK